MIIIKKAKSRLYTSRPEVKCSRDVGGGGPYNDGRETTSCSSARGVLCCSRLVLCVGRVRTRVERVGGIGKSSKLHNCYNMRSTGSPRECSPDINRRRRRRIIIIYISTSDRRRRRVRACFRFTILQRSFSYWVIANSPSSRMLHNFLLCLSEGTKNARHSIIGINIACHTLLSVV